MISVKNLTKYYGDFQALKGISFEIKSGEIVGILGPNGAGKSTLLKILCGVLKPYRGKVKFGKKNLSVAMLPQDAKLVFTEKNVLLDLKRACKDEEEIKKVCELTKIQNLLDRHPYDLSGGERQRAATALLLLKKSAKIPTKPSTASLTKLFFSNTKTLFFSTTKSINTKGKNRLTNKCA